MCVSHLVDLEIVTDDICHGHGICGRPTALHKDLVGNLVLEEGGLGREVSGHCGRAGARWVVRFISAKCGVHESVCPIV